MNPALRDGIDLTQYCNSTVTVSSVVKQYVEPTWKFTRKTKPLLTKNGHDGSSMHMLAIKHNGGDLRRPAAQHALQAEAGQSDVQMQKPAID